MISHRLFFGLLLPLIGTVLPGRAEELPPPQVLRPILHADQEEAELCLEFDRAIEGSLSAAAAAAALHLESEGKSVVLSRKNISLAGSQLCFAPLEHRRDYRVTLAGDQKSLPAYSLSFTVPERRAALAFVNREGKNGLMVWRENPVLHSVDNAQITLELYRIAEPQAMAEAWNQRLQTTLAPSESLYFARHNGTLVWKSVLTPSGAPDRNIASTIDFAGADSASFAPGLYLIAASDADARPVKKSKSEAGKDSGLAPTAAAWLLRSDLRLDALQADGNLIALAATSEGSAIRKDVHILALDRNLHTVGEAQSDASGMASLKPPPEQTEPAQTLIGVAPSGDVAFLDLARDPAENPVLPPLAASLLPDQSLYMPAEKISVALAARDLHKRAVTLAGSVVQMLRPDGSAYDSRAVALNAAGEAQLSFPAPVPSGVWQLVWRQADGPTLAKTAFRVSAEPNPPDLTLTADRAALTEDGTVNLTLRSQNANKPAPYVAGHIELTWDAPEHPFAAWKDYSFDDGKSLDGATKPVGFFLTDSQGEAHVRVELPSPADAPALREARLRIVGEPGQLVLPVKSSDVIVGLKPLAAHGRFSENSLARFSVVALDGEGQRRALDGLTYQIYEEGRSFEWLQHDGRWDYRPQQQRRRIGGGRLSLAADGDGLIEWPVTSGAYRLEISNADGALLARKDFSAGWGFAEKEVEIAAALALAPSTPVPQAGKEETVGFTLARPALVTATVADDHLRSLVHAVYPAGQNFISFIPGADWGNRVEIRLHARYGEEDGHESEAAGRLLLASTADTALEPHISAKPPAAKSENLSAGLPRLLETSRQTIAPHQSWSLADNRHNAPSAQVAFVGPQPLFDLPALLPAALNRHPFATAELARQLALLRQWRELLAPALITEAELHARSNDLLLRLLARQNADGGFASLPQTGSSDLAATAAAVEALAPVNDPLTRPAVEQATGWLQHRLENSWFDEKERPERAAAYAALAAAGKLDLAGLHYFSDTSADKNLPPLAAARLAYAFAGGGDKGATLFWIGKVRESSAKDGATARFSPEVLPLLLANIFFMPSEAAASLERASRQAVAAANDADLCADVLEALAQYGERASTWSVGIGKEEKTLRGYAALPLPEKGAVPIRNPSADKVVYLALAAAVKPVAGKGAVARRIYRLDGGEATGKLARGATYLVMLEGNFTSDAGPLAIHENPAPALRPLGCAIDAPSADSFLGWLAYKSLTTVEACEKSGDGLDLDIARNDKKNDLWRIAYLAEATGGDRKYLQSASFVPLNDPRLPNPDDKDAPH